MRIAVTAFMLLLPTGLFAQSEHISVRGDVICQFALAGLSGSLFDSGSSSETLGSCVFGANRTDSRAQNKAWNWVDSMNLYSFEEQLAFAVKPVESDWTNNFGAGYPNVTSVAPALWSPSQGTLVDFSSTSTTGRSIK